MAQWTLCDTGNHDACSAVESSAKTPRFSYPYGAMNFRMRSGPGFLKISVPLSLSQDEGRTYVSNNLRASLFIDDLSIDAAVIQIHLACPYL